MTDVLTDRALYFGLMVSEKVLRILLLLRLSKVLGSTLYFSMIATVTSACVPRNRYTKECRIIKLSSILLLKLTGI